MNHPTLNRRTMLRGLGGSLIALPLLEEMMHSSALAVTPSSDVPVRAFNVFFGLGIPAPLQTESFDGVLEPLKPLREKLLIMRNVDHVRADARGINAHFDGATAAFTAEAPDGEARAGGPSIDQVVRQTYHPNGMPAHMVPTLVAGTFFRRSRIGRFVHSYSQNGTVAAAMQERPRDVFDRVFGVPGNRRRQRRSPSATGDAACWTPWWISTNTTRARIHRSDPRQRHAWLIISSEFGNTNSEPMP